MAIERKPRKPMPIPTLSERDKASIATTAKANGLGKPMVEEKPEPQQTAPSPPTESADSAPVRAPAAAKAPEPQKKPSAPAPTPAPDKKSLRVSVAPSSDLAQAIRDSIETLSPDAKKFVTTATLLREFMAEHDEQLAKLFRDKHGI
jgi:hypothetical protein